MSENTVSQPSLLDRVKTWFESKVHAEEDAHPHLFAEAVQRIHDLEARVVALEAKVGADVKAAEPVVESAVEQAGAAVVHDVEQAAQSAVTGQAPA